MKLKFTLLFFVVTQILFANNFNDYKNHIAKDKLLVFFQPNISAERKAEIIQQSNVVSSFNHLQEHKLTICFTNDVTSATTYFSALPEVKFVSFFITAGNNFAGVLDNFFVKIKDKNFESLLRQKIADKHLGELVADKYIPNLYKIQNSKSSSLNTIDLCAELQKEGWCEYASPNYLLNPLVCSNDTYFTRQWNLKNTGTSLQGNGTNDADMDVDSAWTITTGDSTIKVGIIDSGVDTLHSDLAANMLHGHDAISDSTDGYPTPNFSEDGHGTCCSGIVAAVKDNNKGIAGVAPSCKILPVRTFAYQNFGGNILPFSTAAAFADAIGWAWNAGADILSNSWGLPASLISILPGGTQPVTDAIVLAHTAARNGKGIAMFFSSGNEEDSTGPIWPGSLAQTIAVNATSMCDERKNANDCSVETWSGNWGAGLDFSAPGVKIASTDMRGSLGFNSVAGGNGDYYLAFNGTSAACPNAAAIGALLLSVNPNWQAEDIRNIIAGSCDKVGGYNYGSVLANGTWSRELGYGRVNAYSALQYSLTYVPTGLKKLTDEVVFKIYPNPSNGTMNIVFGEEKGAMKIYSLDGAQILEQELHAGINYLATTLLPAGIYVAKTDTRGGTVTRKITILK